MCVNYDRLGLTIRCVYLSVPCINMSEIHRQFCGLDLKGSSHQSSWRSQENLSCICQILKWLIFMKKMPADSTTKERNLDIATCMVNSYQGKVAGVLF